MFRGIDAEQQTEGQRKNDRKDVERDSGREALGNSQEHRTIVLDAFEAAAEKVAHIKPVLFIERAIEVELLLEGLLDLRSDSGIELPPGIRAPWSERNNEK